jgi:hypothetical protein
MLAMSVFSAVDDSGRGSMLPQVTGKNQTDL